MGSRGGSDLRDEGAWWEATPEEAKARAKARAETFVAALAGALEGLAEGARDRDLAGAWRRATRREEAPPEASRPPALSRASAALLGKGGAALDDARPPR